MIVGNTFGIIYYVPQLDQALHILYLHITAISILLKGKLKHRAVKSLVQGHTAQRKQSSNYDHSSH